MGSQVFKNLVFDPFYAYIHFSWKFAQKHSTVMSRAPLTHNRDVIKAPLEVFTYTNVGMKIPDEDF